MISAKRLIYSMSYTTESYSSRLKLILAEAYRSCMLTISGISGNEETPINYHNKQLIMCADA
jgi:hypothetical protein